MNLLQPQPRRRIDLVETVALSTGLFCILLSAIIFLWRHPVALLFVFGVALSIGGFLHRTQREGLLNTVFGLTEEQRLEIINSNDAQQSIYDLMIITSLQRMRAVKKLIRVMLLLLNRDLSREEIHYIIQNDQDYLEMFRQLVGTPLIQICPRQIRQLLFGRNLDLTLFGEDSVLKNNGNGTGVNGAINGVNGTNIAIGTGVNGTGLGVNGTVNAIDGVPAVPGFSGGLMLNTGQNEGALILSTAAKTAHIGAGNIGAGNGDKNQADNGNGINGDGIFSSETLAALPDATPMELGYMNASLKKMEIKVQQMYTGAFFESRYEKQSEFDNSTEFHSLLRMVVDHERARMVNRRGRRLGSMATARSMTMGSISVGEKRTSVPGRSSSKGRLSAVAGVNGVNGNGVNGGDKNGANGHQTNIHKQGENNFFNDDFESDSETEFLGRGVLRPLQLMRQGLKRRVKRAARAEVVERRLRDEYDRIVLEVDLKQKQAEWEKKEAEKMQGNQDIQSNNQSSNQSNQDNPDGDEALVTARGGGLGLEENDQSGSGGTMPGRMTPGRMTPGGGGLGNQSSFPSGSDPFGSSGSVNQANQMRKFNSSKDSTPGDGHSIPPLPDGPRQIRSIWRKLGDNAAMIGLGVVDGVTSVLPERYSAGIRQDLDFEMIGQLGDSEVLSEDSDDDSIYSGDEFGHDGHDFGHSGEEEGEGEETVFRADGKDESPDGSEGRDIDSSSSLPLDYSRTLDHLRGDLRSGGNRGNNVRRENRAGGNNVRETAGGLGLSDDDTASFGDSRSPTNREGLRFRGSSSSTTTATVRNVRMTRSTNDLLGDTGSGGSGPAWGLGNNYNNGPVSSGEEQEMQEGQENTSPRNRGNSGDSGNRPGMLRSGTGSGTGSKGPGSPSSYSSRGDGSPSSYTNRYGNPSPNPSPRNLSPDPGSSPLHAGSSVQKQTTRNYDKSTYDKVTGIGSSGLGSVTGTSSVLTISDTALLLTGGINGGFISQETFMSVRSTKIVWRGVGDGKDEIGYGHGGSSSSRRGRSVRVGSGHSQRSQRGSKRRESSESGASHFSPPRISPETGKNTIPGHSHLFDRENTTIGFNYRETNRETNREANLPLRLPEAEVLVAELRRRVLKTKQNDLISNVEAVKTMVYKKQLEARERNTENEKHLGDNFSLSHFLQMRAKTVYQRDWKEFVTNGMSWGLSGIATYYMGGYMKEKVPETFGLVVGMLGGMVNGLKGRGREVLDHPRVVGVKGSGLMPGVLALGGLLWLHRDGVWRNLERGLERWALGGRRGKSGGAGGLM